LHRWLLVSFYGLAVLGGVIHTNPTERSPIAFWVQVLMCAVLSTWAISDAIARGKPFPKLAWPWIFIFAGITVPVYVISSRRWTGALKVLLHGVAWVVLFNVAAFVAYLIRYGW
jgi:hypothetical protein